jgi:hypothetical protein
MYSQTGHIEGYDTACERVCNGHLDIKVHVPPILLVSSKENLDEEASACLIAALKA